MTGIVCGLGYTNHDMSACLMQDGVLIAYAAKERLSRRRRDGGTAAVGSDNQSDWGMSACVQHCLDTVGVSVDDVRLFVANHMWNLGPDELHARHVRGASVTFPRERLRVIPHHFAHAFGAYSASGFSDAAIIVADGYGNSRGGLTKCDVEESSRVRVELASGANPHATEKVSVYVAAGESLTALRKEFTEGSIGGAFKTASLAIFGQHEPGKTMGLAPYGRPWRFERELLAWRDRTIQYPYITAIAESMDVDPIRRWPNSTSEWSDEHWLCADLAWRLQAECETVMVALARDVKLATEAKRLCLGGGVALNSVANKVILDRSGFEDVFILPAAGDDGISIGCAYWGSQQLAQEHEKRRPCRMRSAAVGRRYSTTDVAEAINIDARIDAVSHSASAVLSIAANAIAAGQVVGWYRGGSECGPRALGHRSILANPCMPGMQQRLNSRVKYREAFRPFAPAVIEESACEYFDLDRPSPYMLLVARVRSDAIALIPAVTHVDGTARVQTVNVADEPDLHGLLKAFEKVAGVPILLNTSLNVRGEPIVETPLDAVKCLLRTGMDMLVLDTFVLTKRELSEPDLLDSIPTLAGAVTIDSRVSLDSGGERDVSAFVHLEPNTHLRTPIEPVMCAFLRHVDGQRTCREAYNLVDGVRDDGRQIGCGMVVQKALSLGLMTVRLNSR
jgi:carbamoyltransferase